MSNYNELWRALTMEAQDGFRAASLREDLKLTLEMLADYSCGDDEKADLAKDLNHLWGVAKRWMTHDDYEALQDELYGSDTPSAPQCDDEEFVFPACPAETGTVQIPLETIEALVASVLRRALDD